jgi:hypothetical protein
VEGRGSDGNGMEAITRKRRLSQNKIIKEASYTIHYRARSRRIGTIPAIHEGECRGL